MERDTLLHRYVNEDAAGRRLVDARSDDDASDDFSAFGWQRGMRSRAPMLELRRKTASILAVGYNWLERAEFDPSEGISLSIAGRTIRIKGRNLNAEVRPGVRLFEGIARQRVTWIRETDRAQQMEADEAAATVEVISW